MKILAVAEAAAHAVSAGASRPAVAVLHDSPAARLLVFRIEPGQHVPEHHNTSTVIVTVIAGSGIVTGGYDARRCRAGDTIVLDPREPHSMRAEDDVLVLQAVIAPRPGGA